MNRNSAVYAVLSPEKIPALPEPGNLTICNNANHPVLTPDRHANLEIAHAHLLTALHDLEGAYSELKKQNDIKLNELHTAFALISGYKHIIEQTFFFNAAREPKAVNGLVRHG